MHWLPSVVLEGARGSEPNGPRLLQALATTAATYAFAQPQSPSDAESPTYSNDPCVRLEVLSQISPTWGGIAVHAGLRVY